VRFKDFAVHGQRVEIDAEAERIDVPGPGKAWMLTRQDFNGRKLRRPTAVKTAWSSEMQMRLAEDYGYFVGQVRSETDTFALDCDRLTIRFMPVPPDEMEEGDGQKRFWFLGAIQKDRASVRQLSDQPLVNTERKRPAHVTADGNAVAISSTYAMTEPGEPVGRLLSRFRLAGDQIVADLRREELWLPGTGSLLIEDYQMNPGQASAIRQASGTGPLMSSFSQDGPSQTAISWKNSMKFFVDQNFVDFDREVQMVHRSGQQMVLQKELAEAMRLDEKSIRLSEGRRAALTCGHLIVEFVSENQERPSMMAGEPLRATDVRRLVAKDAVHLEEGTKSLMGEELTYLADQQEITLLGSSRLEARIFDQDEKGQSANMWKGPRLRWNRITNRIESPGASIRSGRR
jgi:hypothetical protein